MGVLGRYNYYNESTQTYDAGQTAKDPYIFEDVLPSDYTDITSIENVNLFARAAGVDYLGERSWIKDLFYDPTKGWANCTDAEKDLIILYSIFMDQDDPNASSYKINHLMSVNGLNMDDSISHLRHSFAEDHVLVADSCNSRSKSLRLYEIVAEYLSNDDALDFKKTIRELLTDYREDALMGTQYSTTTTESGIMDYIKSEVGSEYENIGLASKMYTMQNGDADSTNLINDISDLFADNYKFTA